MANRLKACWLCLALANLLCAQGRGSADAPKAPTDVKPGSITYEGIDYPYPVQYLALSLRRLGRGPCHRSGKKRLPTVVAPAATAPRI